MGKFAKFIAALVIIISVPKIIQNVMGLDEKSQTKKHMAKVVEDIKTKLPMEVAQGLTFTDVEYEGNTLRSIYVIDDNANFDPTMRSQYERNAKVQACNGPFKELGKRGITVEYRYKYKDQGLDSTMTISLPPSTCT